MLRIVQFNERFSPSSTIADGSRGGDTLLSQANPATPGNVNLHGDLQVGVGDGVSYLEPLRRTLNPGSYVSCSAPVLLFPSPGNSVL